MWPISALADFAVNLEMWWSDLPRLARVERAAAAGFTSGEIWYWPNWDVDGLETACRAHNFTISQIGGWDFEPRMCDEPGVFRQAVGRAIEVATRLGASLINLNGPYLAVGEAPQKVRAGVVDALRGAVDLADAAGVRLMVEPMNVRVDHPGYSLPTSADVVAVCEEVGSASVGINWDLYHLQIAEGDLTGHLAEGVSHVAYVQVADHPGRHEPGTGEIDYRFLLRRVRELGYRGTIGLECIPRDTPERAVERILAVAP
jgi:hydroxypyruvate isomerase